MAKLNGGGVVATFANVLSLGVVGSSMLIEALLIIVAGCFALSAPLLSLNSKESRQRKLSPNRFLIQSMKLFLYAPLHTARPCAE